MQHSLDQLRSLEVIDFSEFEEHPIHIVGLGAVGSRLFEQLICLGARNIILHDADVVEAHNLHNQLFCHEDIGKPKVQACYDWFVRKYNINGATQVQCSEEWVTEETELEGLVFCCLDSFDGRRAVMKAAIDSGALQVIEGRCAPKFSEVRTIDPLEDNQVEAFYESLGSDDTPDEYVSVCGSPISFAPIMMECALMMLFSGVNVLNNRGEIQPTQRKMMFINSPMIAVGINSLTGE